MSLNLSEMLGAVKDSYAKAQGEFLLDDGFHYVGDASRVWSFFRSIGNQFVTVIYLTRDGTVRHIVGRQAVHASAQDGKVKGIGHAMASKDKGTLSFWTCTHNGRAVNNGSGKGYRTLRAEGILTLTTGGEQYVTDNGKLIIDYAVGQQWIDYQEVGL